MTDEGRIAGLGLLFDRHHAGVYRFLHALVGNAETARELTQETFYRALKSVVSFQERSAASTWLCGIARNVALNHFRSGRAALRLFTSDEEAAERISKEERPDEELLSRELREAIRTALLDLDEEKRIAFTLKVLEQKSYDEISAMTGSAIPKLKTDVHRARLQMRAALAAYREEK